MQITQRSIMTAFHSLWFKALAMTTRSSLLLTIVAALLRIWRSGRFRRRWLWTIGALFGFGTFALNWTTGQFDFQPLTFNLLGIGFLKNPVFAPWILKFGIPVVAIVALIKYRADLAPLDGATAPI